MLKTKQKSIVKSSPTWDCKTDVKVQKNGPLSEEIASTNSVGVTQSKDNLICGSVNSATQTEPPVTGCAEANDRKTRKINDTKNIVNYSLCDGDIKENNPEDVWLSPDILKHMVGRGHEGHLKMNDNSDKVTVEELSSMLLDLASSLGNAPAAVQKMAVGDINPPDTMKEFIKAMTNLTQHSDCFGEVKNTETSGYLKSAREKYIENRFEGGSEYVTANASDSSCWSVPMFSSELRTRRDASKMFSRMAGMYYDSEYDITNGEHAKNKVKRLVTDNSEYILLKPNEIRNKMKKVMKKYMYSFEKFMDDEIKKQKFEAKVVVQRLERNKKPKCLTLSLWFLVLFIVSIVCVVGYNLYCQGKIYVLPLY